MTMECYAGDEPMQDKAVNEEIRALNDKAAAHHRLCAAAPKMAQLLHELHEELSGYHDTVDGPEGKPYPNWAMHLTNDIEKVLKEAGEL